MRLEKRDDKNAGSWFGAIWTDEGECIGTTWGPDEKYIDEWYAQEVGKAHRTSKMAGVGAEFAEPPKPVKADDEGDEGEAADPDKTLPVVPRRKGR